MTSTAAGPHRLSVAYFRLPPVTCRVDQRVSTATSIAQSLLEQLSSTAVTAVVLPQQENTPNRQDCQLRMPDVQFCSSIQRSLTVELRQASVIVQQCCCLSHSVLFRPGMFVALPASQFVRHSHSCHCRPTGRCLSIAHARLVTISGGALRGRVDGRSANAATGRRAGAP